jgi:hypothetical protein
MKEVNMLGGQKPWVKTVIENFLLIFTILCLAITFLLGKALSKTHFTIFNLLSYFLSIFGFSLLARAKYSIYKKGKFFTFGYQDMDDKNRKFYFFGYVFIVIGLIFTFA